MALFCSDTVRQVNKTTALGEPAWKNAGTEPGLKIWKIVNSNVTDVPNDDYGKFYDGEEYIILNTYREGNSSVLKYDVHFWIGPMSSRDEYVIAAYKTVELDTFLDDKAVQHREVEEFESELFRSYFKQLAYTEPTKYKPRLMQVIGKATDLSIKEVPLSIASLNSYDVFILDADTTVWQYYGSHSRSFQRAKAMEFVQNMEEETTDKANRVVVEEDSISKDHEFYKLLDCNECEEEEDECEIPDVKKLFSVRNEPRSIEYTEVKSGKIDMSDLGSDGVFLFDSREQIFVWIGRNASPAEKRNGMAYAHNHCKKTNRSFVPIHVVKEGRNYAGLNAAISA